jgi:hypothetical protein
MVRAALTLLSAPYVALQQYFSHRRLVIYNFTTSSIKLKLGLQKGERLLIATHMDRSNHLAKIYNRCYALQCLLPTSPSCAKVLGANMFVEANPHVLTFFHPKHTGQCTSGVPLMPIV